MNKSSSISNEELLSMKNFEKSFQNLLDGNEKESDEHLVDEYLTDRFSEAIVKLTPYLIKYKNVKNLEMEIRLGYIEDDNSFTTNVGDYFFEKIKNTLDKTPIWDDKVSTDTTDYFNKGMRLSKDHEDNETVIIKKRLSVFDFTFQGTPFDIRVSFSTETNLSIDEFNKDDITYQRSKKRDSFVYDCWNYDITTVTKEDESNETTESYEIEIEVNRSLNSILGRMSPYYFLHSTFLKIDDISNMCEEQDDANITKLEFIKEKVYNF